MGICSSRRDSDELGEIRDNDDDNQQNAVDYKIIRKFEAAMKDPTIDLWLNLPGENLTEIPYLVFKTYEEMAEIVDAYNRNTYDKKKGEFVSKRDTDGHGKTVKFLTLDFNQLQDLPDAVTKLASLKSLQASGNNISRLPPSGFERLVNLTDLTLNKNRISVFPTSLCSVTNLTQIYMESNQIASLPDEIGLLVNTSHLHLGNNHLTRLPASLGKLAALKSLFLHGNKITELPASVGDLKRLEELDLSWNMLRHLPPTLCGASKLTDLKLSHNIIETLPVDIGALHNLSYLHLSYNLVVTLPDSLASMAKLVRLSVDNNRLAHLPAGVSGAMEMLKYVDVQNNDLQRFPDRFCEISQLASLNASFNSNLTMMPAMAAQERSLPNVKNLTFTHCPALTVLPAFGPSICAALTVLNVSQCALTVIPDAIGCCTALQELKLGDNNIHTLPSDDAFAQLLDLTVFEVYNNVITALPAAVFKLRRIQRVSASINRIASLPDNIGDASATLTELFLSSNPITALPPSVSKLSQLKSLMLSNTRLTGIFSSLPDDPAKLMHLDLSQTEVTGLPDKMLSQMARLHSLNISCTPVQTLSAESLACCPMLKRLYAFDCGVVVVQGPGTRSSKKRIRGDPTDAPSALVVLLPESTSANLAVAPVVTGQPSIATNHKSPSSQALSSSPSFLQLGADNASGGRERSISVGSNSGGGSAAAAAAASASGGANSANSGAGGGGGGSGAPVPMPAQVDYTFDLARNAVKTINKGHLYDNINFFDHIGGRSEMEDRLVIQWMEHEQAVLLAVADGHGGGAAAFFVAQNIVSTVRSNLAAHSNDVSKALHHAYLEMNDQLLRAKPTIGVKDEEGTTLALVVITRTKIYSSNAGDSRVVLGKRTALSPTAVESIRLSKDHKPNLLEERMRIQDAGGFVEGEGKVVGQLSVTRSLGDFHLAKLVIADPFVQEWAVDDTLTHLIVASDGVWDVISDQESVDFAASPGAGTLLNSCMFIRELSALRGSTDNITIIIANIGGVVNYISRAMGLL